jgi:hypothetical protein
MKYDLVVEAVKSNLKLYNIIVDSARRWLDEFY